MNDRVMSADGIQEMERGRLVRANFEAYRDLEWTRQLEPKYRHYGMDAEEIQHFRQEWNAHAEESDWAWWQRRVENQSDAELKAEIAECMAEIKALQMRQPAHAFEAVGRAFLRILNDDTGQPSAEPAHSMNKSRER